MRDNGISGFPDPDASGELTIDAVANGSAVDPGTPAFEQALGACAALEPAGFTGPGVATAEQQDTRLAFARCIRENGVADFPDPAPDAPLVDTNVIPSSATDAGMAVLDAAMAACRDLGPDAPGAP
jgi:hypothetical protein